MGWIQRDARCGPAGIRREGAEAQHVNDPIGAGHGLQTKRRYRVEDGESKTDPIRNPVAGWEDECAEQTQSHEVEAEPRKVGGRGWRLPQIGDVAFVPVERAIERERPTVEANDPEADAEQR